MKRPLLLFFVLLLPLAAPAVPFQAGAATSVITPPLGTSINGGMKDHPALHIHDDLHARAIVLFDGSRKLAIVVNDSCVIPREIFEEAKKIASERTDIPVGNMIMSATHAHSCPTAAPAFQSVPDAEYPRFLARRIADAISTANDNLAPAEIAWGRGEVADQVFNRRWHMQPGTKLPNPFGGTDLVKMNPGAKNPALLEPAGPTDPGVSLLAVRTPEGKPIAVLANYSLHYVGGVGNGDISADYYGAVCDRMQELLHADRQDPPFVGIMSNGTSGDVNNIDFRGTQTRPTGPYAQIRAVADEVAREVVRVYGTLHFESAVTLDSAQTELSLAVRKPSPGEVDQAREILAKAKNPKQLETLPEIYAHETVQMAEYPDHVPVLLEAFRIGSLGIASIPCETFAATGLELKQKSALQPMFTIELANGYNGYLPTPDQHKLGGYETWRAKSSYLETEASTKITAALLDLFTQLKDRAPKAQ